MKNLILFFGIIIILLSCEKEIYDGVFIIEGYTQDENSGKIISNIDIKIDGIKTGEGFLDGSRRTVGSCVSNEEGYYKCAFKNFVEADRYELEINKTTTNEYVRRKVEIPSEEFNDSESKMLDIKLTAATYLKIYYKNVAPLSNNDWFYYGYYFNANGWFKENPIDENYGTVESENKIVWIGKGVDASRKLQVPAENYTTIYWEFRKDGDTTKVRDSIYCYENKLNEFKIEY